MERGRMISDGLQPGGSYFGPSKKWEFPGWILVHGLEPDRDSVICANT